MPDYKEMYHKLFWASAQAIDLLIAVQQECEEIFLSSSETESPAALLPGREKRDSDGE